MEYRNLASRLLLARQWNRQHLVTLEPPFISRMITKALSRTLLRPNIEGVEIKAPIFIIGTPRCGSTMMHQLMCAHDQVVYFTNAMAAFRDPTLFRAIDWAQRNFGLDVRGERYLKDSIIVDSGSPSEAMRFWADTLHLTPFDLTWPQRRLKDFKPQEVEYIKNYIKYVIACFTDVKSPRFLNKSPALFSEVLLLQDLFPDARFIYMVRDGRMVANSLVKLYKLQREQDIKVDHPLFREKPFIPYPRVPGLEDAVKRFGIDDIRTTATIWDSSVKFIDGIRDQVTNFHEIRYEDFLTDPRGGIDKIFDFCQLPPPSAEALSAINARLEKVGVISHQNKYSGFEIVEEIAGDSLRQYHYL